MMRLDGEADETLLPAESTTPESVLIEKADRETVQQALTDLPVPFREILLLCEVEEMSYQEIADTLAIPMGTVMSRLFRARKALRNLLQRSFGRPAWRVSSGAAGSTPTSTANSVSTEANALGAHLPGCPACAGELLERVQLKRSVKAAGRRYAASAELRSRVAKSIAASPRRGSGWFWRILALPALSLLILSIAVNVYTGRESARRQRVYSELADLHAAALASATPVDVVSTDRHTVKPWFQGKIPFSFNLPELRDTEFTLLGGRVTYLGQTPGAHLIYQLRKHEISVFIFQDRGEETASPPSAPVHASLI